MSVAERLGQARGHAVGVGLHDQGSRLPERVTLSVAVTDPDGRPLEGARVTFTLAAPGRAGDHLEADPDRGRRLGGVDDDDPQGRDDRPGVVHGHRPDDAIRRTRPTGPSSTSRSSAGVEHPSETRCARPQRDRPVAATIRPMALWRCPHCGTPQPVAARCWVCRRSSTSCATCRHFRTSVAARIGYCGLDRGHDAAHRSRGPQPAGRAGRWSSRTRRRRPRRSSPETRSRPTRTSST